MIIKIKTTGCLFFILFCSLLLNLSLYAEIPSVDKDGKIYDFADLFSAEQEEKLISIARQNFNNQHIDYVTVFTDNSYGKTPQQYSEEFFIANDFGYGDTYDGIMLYINMQDRDIYILTSGKCKELIDDSYVEILLDRVVKSLTNKDDNFPNYSAALTFLNASFSIMREQLSPVNQKVLEQDQPVHKDNVVGKILIYILFGAVISLVITVCMVYSHSKSFSRTNSVSDYVENRNIKIVSVVDNFISTNTSKTAIPKNDNSSSSGSICSKSSSSSKSSGSNSYGRSSSSSSSSSSLGSSRNFGGGGRKF